MMDQSINTLERNDDEENASFSERKRISVECRKSSSPLSSAEDTVGDEEGNSIPSSSTKHECADSGSSEHSSPDQIEIAASLFASQGIAQNPSLDDMCQNSESTQSIPEYQHSHTEVGKDISSSQEKTHDGFIISTEAELPNTPQIHLYSPQEVFESTNAESMSLPKIIAAKVPSIGSSAKVKSPSNLRRGKWTAEEEAYVARVIQDFNSGYLDAPAATTLRTYLSEKLKCDPMRITKKFTGEACIGKRVFHPAVRNPSNASAIDKAQVCGIEKSIFF